MMKFFNYTSLRIILFFQLIISFSFYCKSNSDSLSQINIQYRQHYGFILAHHSFMNYYIRGHVPSFDLIFFKQTNGNEPWHHLHRFPNYGGGFYAAPLGNPQVLGNAYAVFSYIDFPYSVGSHITPSYNIYAGLAYLTKHFDIENNYINTAIGSGLNLFFRLGIDVKYDLTKKLQLISGIDITHYSNGAVKMPNLGLNIISLNGGANYFFNENHRAALLKDKNYINNTKIEFIIFYGSGIKEINPPGERSYFTSSFCIDIGKYMFRKRKIGIGADLFYDKSLYPRLINRMNIDKFSVYKRYNFRPGIHLSHELLIHKLALCVQVGYYLSNKFKPDGNIYNRFGVRYQFLSHIGAVFSIKTHFTSADHFEIGLAYKL